MTKLNIVISIIMIMIISDGCKSTYYSVWEKLGKEKRHLLRDQVKKTRDDQEKASEQFEDVLTRLKNMYGYDGGELEKFYNKLNADYEECEQRADNVRERIKSVKEIAGDLFKEWEKEIKQINSPELRDKSRKSLIDTKERYGKLYDTMRKSESSMEPVLANLKDYVLFLKHNLNAQAIGTLKKEVGEIEQVVKVLITDMSESIAQAEQFLKDFE